MMEKLALLGNKNQIIFEQAQELYANRKNKNKVSFDTNDFDISFSRGLSLKMVPQQLQLLQQVLSVKLYQK